MKTVHINAGGGYDIHIGPGLLTQAGSLAADLLKADRIAIFTDTTVDGLYGDGLKKNLEDAGFEVCKFVFPAGEQSKNIGVVSEFIDFMSDHGLTRKDAVVALGGGVAGDMGGFAAAIYLRGIKFIQIPTTLLAAVDSSVGGKTGVDIANGKNLIGAFWQPSLVIYDTDTYASLNDDLILDGTAEIIKTAAIRDEELFSHLTEIDDVEEDLEAIVERCVTIKGQVVDADEKEAGLRKILNFGHTMAHAIELDSDYGISHGKAVAMGMIMVTRATERMGMTDAGTFDKLYRLIAGLGYQTQPDAELETLCQLAAHDKKAAGDSISLVGIHGIGQAFWFDVKLDELYGFMRG